MNGWGWVIWGYGVVAVALIAYTWSLISRARSLRRRLEETG